jgi:excisionase family DNA binding protein
MTGLVRIGELAKTVGLHINTLRRLADNGEIPVVRTAGGQRLFNIFEVQIALQTRIQARHPLRALAEVSNLATASWEKEFPLANLQEHEVWQEVVAHLHLDLTCGAGGIFPYAFNEMLNNAIDHSEGSAATIKFFKSKEEWAFEIVDDGCGVFHKVMTEFKLQNVLEAVGELTKGKITTSPKGHTGEGIFFTSKAVDIFELSSDGIQWSVDNLLGDFAVSKKGISKGTRVFCRVKANTERDLGAVFREFTVDYEFVRTRPMVKLFETGFTFVSRSEARRLLARLGKFEEIQFDFDKVESVGQGFVDEIFRVWQNDNPGKKIVPLNMNTEVEFMVKRGMK